MGHWAGSEGGCPNHHSRLGATAPRPEEQPESKDRSRSTSRPGVAPAHPYLVATPCDGPSFAHKSSRRVRTVRGCPPATGRPESPTSYHTAASPRDIVRLHTQGTRRRARRPSAAHSPSRRPRRTALGDALDHRAAGRRRWTLGGSRRARTAPRPRGLLARLAARLARLPARSDRPFPYARVQRDPAIPRLDRDVPWPPARDCILRGITTDPDDPPPFAAAAREPANQGRDLSYPPSFAAEQRRAYPDVRPLLLPQPPGEAFVRAQRAAGELGWKTTYSDPAAGVFEAQQVSPTFLFVDDIVVRVRPESEGSRIDVRSKSRDGKGDLGVNAKRIRAFAQAVAEGK
jgi:uncharacterized protein (DUF1499 family)